VNNTAAARENKSIQLMVPAKKTNYGARSFAVAGPLTWNSLPECMRIMSLSLQEFKSKLKLHIFKKAYFV